MSRLTTYSRGRLRINTYRERQKGWNWTLSLGDVYSITCPQRNVLTEQSEMAVSKGELHNKLKPSPHFLDLLNQSNFSFQSWNCFPTPQLPLSTQTWFLSVLINLAATELFPLAAPHLNQDHPFHFPYLRLLKLPQYNQEQFHTDLNMFPTHLANE